jgi:hypothetical protein
MPESPWVKVTRADGGGVGNDVYVNGNFVDPAGVVGTPFQVETGKDIFQTLDANQKIDWHQTQRIGQPPPGESAANAVPVMLERKV